MGYLITFRCFGTWLHGDARGSVDRHHNQFGTPLLDPDPDRENRQYANLPHEPFFLDALRRQVVEATIRQVSQHRGWSVHALNVRTNHVHVVLSATLRPERILIDLKSWSTRQLSDAGLLSRGVRPWSRHGSTLYLWTEASLQLACRYVSDAQGEPPPTRMTDS